MTLCHSTPAWTSKLARSPVVRVTSAWPPARYLHSRNILRRPAGQVSSSLKTSGQVVSRRRADITLAQHQIGVLGMFGNVRRDRKADHVDFDAVVAGPIERRPGEF